MIKMLLIVLAIIVSIGMIGAVCAQDYNKGARTFREWKVLAEQRHATAQTCIGLM